MASILPTLFPPNTSQSTALVVQGLHSQLAEKSCSRHACFLKGYKLQTFPRAPCPPRTVTPFISHASLSLSLSLCCCTMCYMCYMNLGLPATYIVHMFNLTHTTHRTTDTHTQQTHDRHTRVHVQTPE